mgnify:CR=1 FL=1
MQKNYELVLVMHPDIEVNPEATLKKVEGILNTADAKITKTDNIGKRKLAYKINKLDWGFYMVYELSVDPGKIAGIDGQIKLMEEMLRYLIVAREELPTKKPAGKTAGKE